MAFSIHDLSEDSPGVILENRVMASAAPKLTGCNIQHIRRLAFAGKLDAVWIGRSWLIKVESLNQYVEHAAESDDARFGPRSDDDEPAPESFRCWLFAFLEWKEVMPHSLKAGKRRTPAM